MTKRRINTNEMRTNTTVIYRAIPLFSISYRIECAGCHISSKQSSPTEAKLHSSYPSNQHFPPTFGFHVTSFTAALWPPWMNSSSSGASGSSSCVLVAPT